MYTLIVTVTLNPSIERTCIVEGLEVDKENIVLDQSSAVIGGQVTTGKVIKILQSEPMIFGLFGGLNGRYIKNHMDKLKIRTNIIWMPGETKNKISIVDPVSGTKTVFLDKGIAVAKKEKNRIMRNFEESIKDCSAVVLGDEIPSELEPELFAEMIRIAKERSKKTIITGEGEALRKAVEAHPYALKITKKGLEDLGIGKVSNDKLPIALYELLQSYRIHYLALDLGIEGAYLLSKNKVCYLRSEKTIEPLKTEGATETFMGALAVGIERKYEQEKIGKIAVAASLAAMNVDDQEICRKIDVDFLMKKIKVRELMNQKGGWIRLQKDNERREL